MDGRRDRVFKITDSELNLFSHADFHWMIEKRERGFIWYIAHRYNWANNAYTNYTMKT